MKYKHLIILLGIELLCIPSVSCGQGDIAALQQQAINGDAAAQTRLGGCYYSGDGVPRDLTEATRWYRLAAKQGYAAAQTQLGFSYYTGNGVPQSYTEAVKWLSLAARQGEASALSLLGGCYYLGSGIAQDYAEAAKCLRQAAELGDVVAQYNLSGRYFHGEGVQKDYIQAYAWAHIAATQAHKGAIQMESTCLAEMTPEQVEQGQQLARKYSEKFFK